MEEQGGNNSGWSIGCLVRWEEASAFESLAIFNININDDLSNFTPPPPKVFRGVELSVPSGENKHSQPQSRAFTASPDHLSQQCAHREENEPGKLGMAEVTWVPVHLLAKINNAHFGAKIDYFPFFPYTPGFSCQQGLTRFNINTLGKSKLFVF